MAYEKDQVMLDGNLRERIKYYLVGILKENPDLIVEIGSHTECDGRAEYNQQLTQRRADTIRNHLITAWGSSPEKIIAIGYGESVPINLCNCEGSCEGSEISPFTPYISGVTKKLELEFDARGSIFGEKLEDYTPREIRIVEGNPFVACNDKQHRQNDRITMRIDTSYYNICIDKVYKMIEPIPEPEELHLDEGLGIE
jgi:hypothetical protein